MKKFIASLLIGLSTLGAVATTAFAGKNCPCNPCKCNPCQCDLKK